MESIQELNNQRVTWHDKCQKALLEILFASLECDSNKHKQYTESLKIALNAVWRIDHKLRQAQEYETGISEA